MSSETILFLIGHSKYSSNKYKLTLTGHTKKCSSFMIRASSSPMKNRLSSNRKHFTLHWFFYIWFKCHANTFIRKRTFIFERDCISDVAMPMLRSALVLPMICLIAYPALYEPNPQNIESIFCCQIFFLLCKAKWNSFRWKCMYCKF